jgi:pimeloyl-ACP methyl ester carboxylesterase
MERVVRSSTRRTLVAAGAAAAMSVATLPLAFGPGAAPASAQTPPATTTAAAPAVDVVSAPIHVAETSAGPVAYREVGHGTPLVLVMGFAGTMDDWAPSFVDQLASSFRVVEVDNAGVGKTAAVSPPLTVTAMAGQLSALVSALALGRTAVLGWSMGGMIAQALAVLHPSQVSRLVLAATQAGTGKALPVPVAAAAAAASPNPAAVLSVLFPHSQTAVALAYAGSLVQYPGFYVVTPATKTAQESAVTQWLRGADAAGRAEGSLRVPTLVADGTMDALDPVANSRLLASTIHGAQLVLYPGAGHAFWFQDEGQFVPRVEAFLK